MCTIFYGHKFPALLGLGTQEWNCGVVEQFCNLRNRQVAPHSGSYSQLAKCKDSSFSATLVIFCLLLSLVLLLLPSQQVRSIIVIMIGLPLDSKESACNVGSCFDPWVRKMLNVFSCVCQSVFFGEMSIQILCLFPDWIVFELYIHSGYQTLLIYFVKTCRRLFDVVLILFMPPFQILWHYWESWLVFNSISSKRKYTTSKHKNQHKNGSLNCGVRGEDGAGREVC